MQPSEKPRPTVGRIIHMSWNGDPVPAIVTALNDEGFNATVFWPDGHPSRWFFQYDGMNWSWPPRE